MAGEGSVEYLLASATALLLLSSESSFVSLFSVSSASDNCILRAPVDSLLFAWSVVSVDFCRAFSKCVGTAAGGRLTHCLGTLLLGPSLYYWPTTAMESPTLRNA